MWKPNNGNPSTSQKYLVYYDQSLSDDCSYITVDGAETAEVQDRLVYCYPVRLSIPSPPQPRVELHFENDIACLRYKGEMVKVNRGHFNKLVGLTVFGMQNGFLILCVLHRYDY